MRKGQRMTNRTSAYGGAMPRIVPLDKAHTPTKTAAHGGGVTREKRDVPSPFDNFIPPYPRQWPFDPAEPKPRPQTWGNRFKAFRRYLASEAFSEHVQWALSYAIMFGWVWYAYGYGR